MVIAIVLLLSLLFILGPQWWATYTFRRYGGISPRIPGNGASLARHLLEHFDITDVQVEEGKQGSDHYDPARRVVSLGADNYHNNSLTAIAVAAHEVGHAIQHHRNDRLLALRTRLVTLAASTQQLGAGAMFLLPLVMIVTRVLAAGLVMAAIGLGSMASATLVHLVTLPVEIDASFGKALPILKQGRYVGEADEKAVRRILRAAALTYVAGSLASLLNLARWFAFLRRA